MRNPLVQGEMGHGAEAQTRFTEDTPIGSVEFTNLIFTFDPGAARKIILSAHFDSKWFPDYPANTVRVCHTSLPPSASLPRLHAVHRGD
jgi:glutaminyl-peptide cyclotransferase